MATNWAELAALRGGKDVHYGCIYVYRWIVLLAFLEALSVDLPFHTAAEHPLTPRRTRFPLLKTGQPSAINHLSKRTYDIVIPRGKLNVRPHYEY